MTKPPPEATDSVLLKPQQPADGTPPRPRQIGGPKGPEPTRYGDREVGGRCTDF